MHRISWAEIAQEDFDFILAGNVDIVFFNIPEGLKKAGFKTLLIGAPGMRLLESKWIDSVIQLGSAVQASFLDELMLYQDSLKSLKGTFLWSSDEVMREIVERKIPEDLKRHLLPVKNPAYFSILGSKIGQSEMFSKLGIATPDFNVIESKESSNLVFRNDKKVSIALKGDQSGGGAFVKRVAPGQKVDLGQLPRSWFPLLVQDWLEGETISVEAYYKGGSLKLWLYSDFVIETGRFGPSMVRRYNTPPSLDFISHLEKIGSETQLNGMVNVSYIRNRTTNQHQIIEFDARPNVWHQAFIDFGIPFRDIWNQQDSSWNPIDGPRGQLRYEPSRLFNYFVKKWNLIGAWKVLKKAEIPGYGSPITSAFYEFHSFSDSLRMVALLPLLPFGHGIIRIGVRVKRLLPERIRIAIDRSRLKPALLRIFLGN